MLIKRAKPDPECAALLRQMHGLGIMRTHGEVAHYALTSGEQLDAAIVERAIKRGWIEGNRDGLFQGWSQSYKLSASGERERQRIMR